MSMRLPSSNLFGANEAPQFDTWNLANRPHICEPYTLTTKYRQCKNPVTRKFKGVIGFKRKRRPESRAESEGGESIHSHATSDLDLDKEFPDDFDYDAEVQDDTDPKVIIKRTPSQELYIRACKFLDVVPVSCFMRHLEDEKIQLRHHFLGSDGTKACCMALLSNSTVTSLDLTDTNLGVDGARHIADLLRENHFITDLTLAENTLGIDGIKPILDVMEQLDNIISLNLSGTGLKEKDAEGFRGIFEETQHLKRLVLSHNEFREVGGEIFGELIGYNDTLEVLDLSWNHLRNDGAKELAAGLEDNKGLRLLDVSWNGFHQMGCQHLADALQVNTELQELNLNCNRINKDCLEKLLKGFKQNSTLRTLRLAWNPITSAGAQLVLNMCEERTDVGLKEIDIHTQIVEPSFADGAHKLDNERGIKILYGMVRGQDMGDGDQDEDGLLQENPTLVLMEFARLMGFRPIDLLSTFDKDKSNSLDKEEIKMGLKLYCIPLSDRCLDFMVQKLDVDGDGEIDLNRTQEDREVMQAKVEYKLKEREMHNASKNWNFAIENTEIGRVRIKLQRLMQRKMDGNPTFRARVDLFQEALKEGKLKSVFNDKKEKAKERERIQQRRLNKRQQAEDEILQENEDDAKLKLDLGIEAEDTTAETSRIGSGSRRESTRPSSEHERLTGRSENNSHNKNSTSLSQSPKTSRPNSGRPASSTRPRSSHQRGARNSGGGSSRPSSSNVNTGRTSVDTARTDSRTVSSHSNTERRNGSNGNDWKPLNF
ncbi:leucine-rich repeat-containing protein 74A-like isoform X3 [Ostrea edulis]|uniref:leucine-rich repeat-containing protein 74A-like isoform X3 n=1 Tax=Ostrea edulis TaxID=37623 RepID=UPI0020952A9D|nr:leucine-rich repeat-containing protein 74A-like isoform X3 [Ostrea edulis]